MPLKNTKISFRLDDNVMMYNRDSIIIKVVDFKLTFNFNIVAKKQFKDKERQKAIDRGLIILPVPKKEHKNSIDGIHTIFV